MEQSNTDRIFTELRSWVSTAAPGAKLPSNRELTTRYAASPGTVQRATRALADLGLVEAKPGVGTFVRATSVTLPVDYGWQTAALGSPRNRFTGLAAAQRDTGPDMIGLHTGYPDPALLPQRLVRAAVVRAARTTATMTRAPAAGIPELRAWFAAELTSAAPDGVSPATGTDVIVLPGSQSGLSSIFRALVGPGQAMLVESPTYWGAILAAAQVGVSLVPVRSGPEGPDPEDVAHAFEQSGARAFYAQPNYANPSGAQWSAELSRQVLDLVRRYGAFLIEDDWAHDLGIDTEARPIAAHDSDGHVVYLRSLTKSVSPALRVAALIARGPARTRILAEHSAESMYVSGLLQIAALDVVTQPAWRTHLRALRHQLRARRDLLVDSVREHAPSAHLERAPVGGLNLWLRLRDGTDLSRLVHACEARGVMIAPGTEWFPAEAPSPYIRLNYAGPHPEQFREVARAVGDALESP